jgi:hypothetical protein
MQEQLVECEEFVAGPHGLRRRPDGCHVFIRHTMLTAKEAGLMPRRQPDELPGYLRDTAQKTREMAEVQNKVNAIRKGRALYQPAVPVPRKTADMNPPPQARFFQSHCELAVMSVKRRWRVVFLLIEWCWLHVTSERLLRVDLLLLYYNCGPESFQRGDLHAIP